MRKAEIKITVDLTAKDQREALEVLFDAIARGSEQIKVLENEQTTEQRAEEVVEKQKEAPKKTSAPKKKNTKAGQPDVEEGPRVAISIKEIREAVSSKTATHRKELKNKLKELGANNVTALEESKYSEFMDFVTGL